MKTTILKTIALFLVAFAAINLNPNLANANEFTNDNGLVKVETMEELGELKTFSGLFYRLTLQETYVDENREAAIGGHPELESNFDVMFSEDGMGYAMRAYGDIVPAKTLKAVFGHLSESNCLFDSDNEEWSAGCEPLMKRVVKAYNKAKSHVRNPASNDYLKVSDKIMETASVDYEGEGGHQIVIAYGALAELTEQVSAEHRPWDISSGSAGNNDGWSISPDFGWGMVLNSELTTANTYHVGGHAQFNLEGLPIGFGLGLGYFKVFSGGIASHYTEDSDDAKGMWYLSGSVAYTPMLTDWLGLTLSLKGTALGSGGHSEVVEVSPDFYLWDFVASPYLAGGYGDMALKTGQNKGNTTPDSVVKGAVVNAGFRVGFRF